jgi:hypothetical protein
MIDKKIEPRINEVLGARRRCINIVLQHKLCVKEDNNERE